MTKAKVSELIAQARALTEPDQVVALATSYGHHGVGLGHYCEFYIAPANRLASTGRVNEGRAIMQAGQDKGHVTWLQRAAWEDFVKYTEKLLASNSTTNEEVKAMKRKEVKAILHGLGIFNRFSLKTVNFNWDTRQVLSIKDWEPGPKNAEVKAAFHLTKVIVEFDGPRCLFS